MVETQAVETQPDEAISVIVLGVASPSAPLDLR